MCWILDEIKSSHCWFFLIFMAAILLVGRIDSDAFHLVFQPFHESFGQILFISLGKILNYNGVLNWNESNSLKGWTILFSSLFCCWKFSAIKWNVELFGCSCFLGPNAYLSLQNRTWIIALVCTLFFLGSPKFWMVGP